MNSSGPTRSRAIRRSLRNGEIKLTSAMKAGLDHELCDFGDPANILNSILVRKAEIAIEPVTDIVAVQKDGMTSEPMQHLLEQIRDRRLAGSRQARKPEDTGLLTIQRRPRRLVDLERLPMDIGRAT